MLQVKRRLGLKSPAICKGPGFSVHIEAFDAELGDIRWAWRYHLEGFVDVGYCDHAVGVGAV